MKLRSTKTFDTKLKRFVRKDPRYRKRITKTLRFLSENPDHPSLRLHKITGETFSISVDMKIRILVRFDQDKIILLTIGSHEEVYN